MRDMSSVYFNMSMQELKKLKSKKTLRLMRLREQYAGYLVAQEIKTLNWQIARLDAVMAAKEQQLGFET